MKKYIYWFFSYIYTDSNDPINSSSVFFGTYDNLKQCTSEGHYKNKKGITQGVIVKHNEIKYALIYVDSENNKGILKIIKNYKKNDINHNVIDSYTQQNESVCNDFKTSILERKTKVEFLNDNHIPEYLLKHSDDKYYYISREKHCESLKLKLTIYSRNENENIFNVHSEPIDSSYRLRDGGSTFITTKNFYFELRIQKPMYCNKELITEINISDDSLPSPLKTQYNEDYKNNYDSYLIYYYSKEN